MLSHLADQPHQLSHPRAAPQRHGRANADRDASIGCDHFRAGWERAAWHNAGDRPAEGRAKRALVAWRLHGLLAGRCCRLLHEQGVFVPADVVLRLRRAVSAGISANYVQTGLADVKGKSTTFDFGTLYDIGLLGAKIGMSIQNVGSDMTFLNEKVKMPTFFRVGGSVNLLQRGDSRVLTVAEFTHPSDNSEKVNWGAEYAFHDYLFLRGGYKFNYDTEGMTAGLGVKFPLTLSKASVARLDYAYQDLKLLTAAHRVSVNVSF